jgi:outer membrane lipopolysaccharide assembly protein LptE/RlpB
MVEQRKHMRKISTAVTVAVLLATLGACGYHVKGSGFSAPEGVHTIAVTLLENRTSESGIETVFTSDLAYEFTRSKVLGVVDAETADAVLRGSIRSMRVETISHTKDYGSAERRVTMTLDLTFVSREGKVLWSDSNISDYEAYKVFPDDKFATDRKRRDAIEIIAERLAEKVHNRILQGF